MWSMEFTRTKSLFVDRGLNIKYFSGILSSGGIITSPGDVSQTLELFVPSTGITNLCSLMILPVAINSHTLNIINKANIL